MDLRKQDLQHLWHPYTRFSTLLEDSPAIIERGEGIYLIDSEGRRFVDAISSWWCCNLGHGHPRIIEAIRKQAGELQHSILGNLSHPRAIELAVRLAALMPDPKRHVLFASDGSSAVEQALKIAVQYMSNTRRPQRHRFACIQDAYHGDTLGAMSVGYLDHFHKPFRPLLAAAVTLPFPRDFAEAETLLNERADELAAVIVEPLCLGAAGMRMYGASWLRQLADWCRAHDVLLIDDEIAMGFGRTGKMFAFEHSPLGAGQAGIDPDIVCAGKALSGGYLPISATIVKDVIYETFGDKPEEHTLQHGHTFSGNPLAAAAALAALDIYESDRIVERAAQSGRLLAELVRPLGRIAGVKEVRCLGMIAAVELQPEPQPLPATTRPHRIRRALLKEGILLRPLGSVVYLMPPLTIAEKELRDLVNALERALRQA